MVPPGPYAWSPPLRVRPRTRPRRLWLAPVGVLVAVAIGLAFVPLRYYAISPGRTEGVEGLVALGTRAPAFPAEGDVLLVTVSQRKVTAYELLAAWLDDDVTVYKEESLTVPGVNVRVFNAQLMLQSQEDAVVAALREVGYRVREHGTGAYIAEVQAGSPADGRVTNEDVIVRINGKAIETSSDAVRVLSSKDPGDVVRVRVLDLGSDEFRTVTARLADRGDGTPQLGVVLQTMNPDYDLPFQVGINTVGIGGPSAGLAFALAIIDRITAGDLTGGAPIAVTGTIDVAGNVGPIGGIEQKVVTVERSGADVFLVPADNAKEAKAKAGDDLRIISIATLEDALAALRKLGGDPARRGRAG